MNIELRIGAYLKEKGIKQTTLTRAGLTDDQASGICNGKRKVSALEYYKICKLLDVSLDTFVREEDLTECQE